MQRVGSSPALLRSLSQELRAEARRSLDDAHGDRIPSDDAVSWVWSGRRFGTMRACFSTASVSRPSAGATVGLLSANSRRSLGLPQTAAVDPLGTLEQCPCDA